MSPHPTLPGRLASGAELTDSARSWPVARTEAVHDSAYLSLTIETIVDPDGGEHPRAVVRPHGAVGVVALDDDDRVLLVEQYRHPVQRRLLEIPAGTLDVEGEAPADAAARELAEEADVVAAHWEPLIAPLATPGYSSEAWQIFSATGLTPVPDDDRTTREAEEADMTAWWVPFDEAVDAVLDGRISDAMTVAAILATRVQRQR
jgi:8-oxo-dGTP pyrophosphatase MutT (NUDIX family)